MNATTIALRELAKGEAAPVAAPPTRTESSRGKPVALEPPQRGLKSRRLLVLGALVFAIAAGGVGYRWWDYARTWSTTDNAYVSGHVHTVSARVSGNISEVLITDNQTVQASAVLARLDPADLRVQRDKVNAALAAAEAQVAQARAQVIRDTAMADKAQLDFERARKLFGGGHGAISQQEYDDARTSCDATKGALNATKALVLAAEAQVKVAAAQLKDVDLQLSYMDIVAPAAGRIGRKNLEVGNRVQAGQALLAIVQPEVWVTANFKETQLKRLRPGQKVSLEVDSFPAQEFAGKVDSISPASGAQFALLPPDNATGNFTKIVQRVPVKIVFDEATIRECAGRLVPGMSVVVRVNVRHSED